MASRIAAQAADAASKLPGAWKSELEMANARKSFDWDKQFEMAFDSRKPAEYRMQCPIDDSEMCTMCGEYCALRILRGD